MKTIVLLELGGTISSHTYQKTSEFYNLKGESISSFIDDFSSTENINIQYELFCNKISHELTIRDLLSLGNKIQDIVDRPDVFGLVVSMGTNAMEDVAYFIGLVVNTRKSMVFTGAHFPQNNLAFDGRKNIFNALVVATSDCIQGAGVVITLNDTVVSSRWATKNKPGIPNDFSCEGFGILGYVAGSVFHQKMIPVYKHTFNSIFSIRSIRSLPKTAVLYAHFGFDIHYIQHIIDNSSVEGIISAGYGKGYQTREASELLCKAATNGIPVVRCTRAGQSVTNIDINYDDKYGSIVASDFSPHKASLLLAVCLSQGLTPPEIQDVFEEY